MNKKTKTWTKTKILKFLLIFCLALSLLLIALLSFIYYKLPDVTILRKNEYKPLIHIKGNNNELIKTYGTEDNNYIIYEELPGYLVDAVLAIEDKKFFSHYGIDFFALPRAVIYNLKSGYYAQGASTITQQLAKLYFLTPEKTIKRKITEMLLAFKLEKNFSKKEIFELYLNKAYFGSGNYGIYAAAFDYFNKNITEISLHEAALLAGLLKAPSKYSPKNNPELSAERTNLVLEIMLKNKFISEEEFVISLYQDNAWDGNLSNTDNYKYYLNYILDNVEETQIFPFNININTTYDTKLTKIIDKIISKYYKNIAALNNTQIAIIAMSHNGEIKAMFGGYNYKKSQYNRSIYAKRQPGSAFKIFTYLEAFEQGYNSDDQMIDEEITIDNWQPKNYDSKYRGKVTLREAFARSINSVAAKLANEIGTKNIINRAKSLGITSQIKDLPSIALGTSEVSLIEMVNAYSIIANGGYYITPYAIKNITDNYNNILYQNKQKRERIISKKAVKKIANLLHGVVIWGTGKNAQIINKTVKGKTGTSQNYRDAWFIGFTDDLVLGIWTGNDKNQPLENISGGGYPAIIFSEILTKYYQTESHIY
jgi:penicillin-binding protein 1A